MEASLAARSPSRGHEQAHVELTKPHLVLDRSDLRIMERLFFSSNDLFGFCKGRYTLCTPEGSC